MSLPCPYIQTSLLSPRASTKLLLLSPFASFYHTKKGKKTHDDWQQGCLQAPPNNSQPSFSRKKQPPAQHRCVRNRQQTRLNQGGPIVLHPPSGEATPKNPGATHKMAGSMEPPSGEPKFQRNPGPPPVKSRWGKTPRNSSPVPKGQTGRLSPCRAGKTPGKKKGKKFPPGQKPPPCALEPRDDDYVCPALENASQAEMEILFEHLEITSVCLSKARSPRASFQ